MQHLSRRFSGFVFLYIVIAGLMFHAVIILSLIFPEFYKPISGVPLRLIRFLFIYLFPLIFISARRYPLLKLLRVKTFSLKSLWFTLGISIFLFLFVRMLGFLVSGLMSTAMNPEGPVFYFSSSYHNVWWYVISYCLIPALLEVMVFQGVIQSGLQGLKPLRSCLYTGLLFALFMLIGSLFMGYLNFVNFIPLVIIGFVISYVSTKAGSVIPGMITVFLLYFLNYADIEDWFYFRCLMPLGISENLAVIILAMLSVIIGGILLVKMPSATASRTLNIPSPRKIIIKLIKSRENLKRSWLWREEDNAARPAEEQRLPEISEPDERLVYPDDSEKQKKGIGFKTGIIIVAAAVLCDLGVTIYLALTGAF